MATTQYQDRPKKFRPRSRSAADTTDTETQPLLSSDVSRTSLGPPGLMFYDSETSDFEATSGYNSQNESRYSYFTFRRPYQQIANGLQISDFHYFNKSKYDTNLPVVTESAGVLSTILASPESSKQNSIVTIFAVWNTMVGTSLLAMPWGIERAGLVAGVVLILAMGALCLYTAYCVLTTQKAFGDSGGEISELSQAMLGRSSAMLSKIFSFIVLLGANIVYWILMSNFLYYSVHYVYNAVMEGSMRKDYIYPNVTGLSTGVPSSVVCPKMEVPTNRSSGEDDGSLFHEVWNLEYTVPIFLVILISPLLNFKSATFFTKFNSFGTMSVVYLLVFVAIKATNWGINMDLWNKDSISYSPWIAPSFPATSGMLGLSYLIHNIIITVMRNNRHQENNGRDLTVAYALVTLTYVLIGSLFYVTFPLAKYCIEDNLLNNFASWDLMTMIARVFLFFQLVTVFPLISFMLRIQVMTAIFTSPYPNRTYIVIFNGLVVLICVLFAIFLPRIGTIIRYTGALSGVFLIFTLPPLLRLVAQKRNNTLTAVSVVIHGAIPIIGVANLLAQFFISDS